MDEQISKNYFVTKLSYIFITIAGYYDVLKLAKRLAEHTNVYLIVNQGCTSRGQVILPRKSEPSS